MQSRYLSKKDKKDKKENKKKTKRKTNCRMILELVKLVILNLGLLKKKTYKKNTLIGSKTELFI